MCTLPVDALLPQLRRHLAQRPNLVLQAAPGAGKTTRVPLALLDCEWLEGRRILMLEPRRLAARAAARYMAASLGEKVGETVGYRVRLDSRVGPRTRVEVVTEGVLGRLLQDDPALEGTGAVIFDEFHERSLQADLGLALCLDSQASLRQDLRLLVMSATLDGAGVAALLGDAPVLSSAGRSFAVELRHRPLRNRFAGNRRAWCDEVAGVVAHIVRNEVGSLLVFLPGSAEIGRVAAALQASQLPADVSLAPLHGRLDARAQDAAIQPPPAGRRKIVLATAIAETSLTIEGIALVVDAGLSRESRFDAGSGLDRLVTVPVSRAAAEQRAGRAGRLAAGICYRLWAQSRHLVPQAAPEVTQADLAPLLLELAHWGVTDHRRLRWLDLPPAAHVNQARELLVQLQAVDSRGRITQHGRSMSRLGTHPRLAHMILRGHQHSCAVLACELAALLSAADPLRGDDSDMRLRVEWLRGGLQAGREETQRRQLRSLASQWCRQLGVAYTGGRSQDLALCGALLAFAYPDRIAQRRPGSDSRFLLSNGRGACFRDLEPLAAADLLVAAHLDGGREARIFLAAALNAEQLRDWHQERLAAHVFVAWDARAGCVQARRQQRLGALVLSDQPLEAPDPDAVLQALLSGVRDCGSRCLPWNAAARRLQARVNFLHALDPTRWPDFSDAALLECIDSWLAGFLDGITRLAQLRQIDLAAALSTRLDWSQQQELERLAPTHLQVPSGSRLRVDYSGPVPVLAVRLQEMFGLAETPSVAAGRVPVLLHLLSPAQRPVQVTQDLGAFWAGGYREVRKELRGRYPRHAWPEDPLTAQPLVRARPRR